MKFLITVKAKNGESQADTRTAQETINMLGTLYSKTQLIDLYTGKQKASSALRDVYRFKPHTLEVVNEKNGATMTISVAD